ncbi:general secretion pathway protein GspH [Aliidongia dinghuensis]|uniref:Type II secretion system protein H n=1 Tax=Aliidongia dinghuensis TaxID=1867774 RepID=A0A8J2YV07_9PROT|nr:GspH/FimT family pseudopilin [Aliidongia dinghuensis]GGF23642.1 general secretion pathway protein GspH [Aliidongia dinghuensis]
MTWRSEICCSGRPSRRRAGGFTLIEMVVVLAIMGLVLAMVAARGPLGMRTLTARAAGNELASGFRQARARAIADNRPVEVSIDLAAHNWRIGNDRPTAFPRGLEIAVLTVAGQTRGDQLAQFRFLPDGSSTGGRVELKDGRRRLRVGIDWLNGRVSVGDAN